MSAGAGLYYLVWEKQKQRAPFIGAFFWAIALSVTSFPDLARMLSDLKLMYTDLGKTALTAAAVSDVSSWFLLVGTISLINAHEKLHVAIPVILSMTAFWFMMRPLIAWLMKQAAASKETSTEGKYSDKHGFDQQTFSWIVSALLIMTIIICPIVSFTHKSARHLKQYYHRNLQKSKDAPLRILACVYSTRNLSGLINLLQISNATRRSPITVFAVHLVELTGRATAMLIFHDKHKEADVGKNATREKAEAEQIVSAFESFENDNHAATVQPLTAVSPYDTMHEDVSNFALDKHANIILIPFHKQPSADGGWTDENLQHKQVNQNLLASAPCTIGLLVDRGLTSSVCSESQNGRLECRIAMLFVEGPDDREALAYAWRMVGTPGLNLTVVRFLPGKDVYDMSENAAEDDESGIFTAMFEREKEKQFDDDYVNEFRFRTMHDKSVAYIEKQVNSGDQIVSIVTSDYNNFDLYIVGRGHGTISPLTSGLSNWSDFPELGPLGETLVSTDFESPTSVLVVQQSAPPPSGSKRFGSSAPSTGIFGNSMQSAVDTFVNHRRSDDDY
ncbi:hypothetical protein SCA6_015471 [Theobroma cacao]